jgi:hypothetical protein
MRIISVGRDPSNDIIINDNFVSRKHAQFLILDNEQIIIKDLGSHNGTYVNGNRIAETNLSFGDAVKCGSIVVDWLQYIQNPSQVATPYQPIHYTNISTTIIETPTNNYKRNGLGVAGFVLSLIGATFCWVPLVGFTLLILACIFSLIGFIIGLSKRKNFGLSLAGLIISSTFFIIALIFISVIGTVAKF